MGLVLPNKCLAWPLLLAWQLMARSLPGSGALLTCSVASAVHKSSETSLLRLHLNVCGSLHLCAKRLLNKGGHRSEWEVVFLKRATVYRLQCKCKSVTETSCILLSKNRSFGEVSLYNIVHYTIAHPLYVSSSSSSLEFISLSTGYLTSYRSILQPGARCIRRPVSVHYAAIQSSQWSSTLKKKS